MTMSQTELCPSWGYRLTVRRWGYIPETRHGEEVPISRLVFERVAREGRKYGLELVIASRRPSELSKTVLSQCSSLSCTGSKTRRICATLGRSFPLSMDLCWTSLPPLRGRRFLCWENVSGRRL